MHLLRLDKPAQRALAHDGDPLPRLRVCERISRIAQKRERHAPSAIANRYLGKLTVGMLRAAAENNTEQQVGQHCRRKKDAPGKLRKQNAARKLLH